MAKKSEYEIKMKDGTTKMVSGIIINERWGIDKREIEVKKETKDGAKTTLSYSYCLTHIPTGILITSANTQKTLKELVNREDMYEEDDLDVIFDVVIKFWNSREWQG